jgi:hypothetical protein
MTRGKITDNNSWFLMMAKRNPDAFRALPPRFLKALTCYLITDHAHLADLAGTALEPWINAIEAADDGDKKQLLKLLKSDQPLPKAARDLLADLLGRYQLKHRRGRRKTAGYRLTPQHIKMQSARTHYKKLRSEKVKPKVALKRAAEEGGVLQSELAKYLDGKIPRYRRQERRIEALRPPS